MYLLYSIFSFFAARSPYVLEIIEHYCCTYIGLFGAVFNSSAKGLDVIPHQKQQTSYNGCPEFHRFRHGSFLHIFNSISCAAEKCNNVEEKQSKWWKEHKHLKKKIEEEGYQITTCDKQEMRPDISRWHGEDRWGFSFFLLLRQSHAGLMLLHSSKMQGSIAHSAWREPSRPSFFHLAHNTTTRSK